MDRVTRAAIVTRAAALGLDAIGICSPVTPERDRDRLRSFLAEGEQGDMTWMAANADRRADPRLLWPGVRSIIVVGLNYAPAENPLSDLAFPERAAVSVYARNRDYHDIFKKRLKRLAGALATETGAEMKVFVDTAPVLERALAAAGGLGWQGKHTNLVSRRFGSWLFLGEIFTSLDLPPDPPQKNLCGSCRACLDICPTDAFPAPGRLDARRCIAYLTIEHKGPIPREFRKAIGNRVYGCDDCLAVCPWNKFAAQSREAAFQPREALTAPRLADFLELDDAAFRALFTGSPIKRTGRDRFLRNVLTALGNSSIAKNIPAVITRLGDASPLVRGAAVWALSQLLDPAAFAALRRDHEPAEQDPETRREWRAADA